MRDKKQDAAETRKDRELDVYVRPSSKKQVLQKAINEGISRSQVVDEILYEHFKNNPVQLRPNFDY